MKLILVLAAVLVGIWLFRSNRRSSKDAPRAAEKSPPQQLEMVRCRQCDMHLPKTDAITGKKGLYCSLEHRASAES